VQLPQATHFLGLIRIVFPSREKQKPFKDFCWPLHLRPVAVMMQVLSAKGPPETAIVASGSQLLAA
jgi:hypothetical protein